MLLRTPVWETAITSLPRGKFLTVVSCPCLAVANFAIFAKNIQKRLSVYLPKVYIVISAVPWRCPLGDWRVSLLIQWQWPVRQRTGLTKTAGHPGGHPGGRRQAVSQLSLPQVPRGFGVCRRGFPALLPRSTCLETAKPRRLAGKRIKPFPEFLLSC